jgi:hypothetical protein
MCTCNLIPARHDCIHAGVYCTSPCMAGRTAGSMRSRLAGWLPGLPHMLPADSIAVVVLDITQHRRLTEIVECTTCRPISQYIPLISPYLTPPPPSRSPSLPPLSTSTQRGPSLISKPAASSVPSRTSSLQQGHNSHPSHGLRLSAVARTLPPRWTTATTTKQHTADRSAAHY